MKRHKILRLSQSKKFSRPIPYTVSENQYTSYMLPTVSKKYNKWWIFFIWKNFKIELHNDFAIHRSKKC